MTPPYQLGTDPSTDSLPPIPSSDSYVHTYPQTDREREKVERDGRLLSNAHEHKPDGQWIRQEIAAAWERIEQLPTWARPTMRRRGA